jgi:hypothetical protein
MKIRPRTTETWAEFADGLGSNVALNVPSFHHICLIIPYAKVYRDAARRLFERYWQDGYCMDAMELHPIIFLYRHAVELYLKGILWAGNDVLLVNGKHPWAIDKIFGGHKLKRLLPGVREILSLIDCSNIWAPPLCESLADVERIVKAIDGVKQDAFRYPVDVKGVHENLERSLCFNDLGFFEKANAAADTLEAAAKRTQETVLAYFYGLSRK